MPKVVIVLLVMVLGSNARSAQIFAFLRTPPRVRFIGVLLPIEDESQTRLHDTLIVLIKEKRWIFRLDKVKILGGISPGRVLLQRLFPPIVRFVGPKGLIDSLQKPDIVGKRLTVEGLLYTGSRLLFVTAVDEIKEPGPIESFQ